MPLLDRKLEEISPIEHGVMWIGAYEFLHCPDVPWRVVLNECIELAKEFGGTDGHKYVNAVLNGLAPPACAPPRSRRTRQREEQEDENLRARRTDRAVLRDGGGQGGFASSRAKWRTPTGR